jgi:hypothetical protein
LTPSKSQVIEDVGAGRVLVVRLLILLAAPSWIYNVTVGTYVVETTTTPGYAKRVAVTSIWHWLVQEIDGREDETELGATELGTTELGTTELGTTELGTTV